MKSAAPESTSKPNAPGALPRDHSQTAEAQGKHKKQSGGHAGQYGDVYVRYSPLRAARASM